MLHLHTLPVNTRKSNILCIQMHEFTHLFSCGMNLPPDLMAPPPQNRSRESTELAELAMLGIFRSSLSDDHGASTLPSLSSVAVWLTLTTISVTKYTLCSFCFISTSRANVVTSHDVSATAHGTSGQLIRWNSHKHLNPSHTKFCQSRLHRVQRPSPPSRRLEKLNEAWQVHHNEQIVSDCNQIARNWTQEPITLYCRNFTYIAETR